MGVPLVIHFRLGFSLLHHPFRGTPHVWKPPYESSIRLRVSLTSQFPNSSYARHGASKESGVLHPFFGENDGIVHCGAEGEVLLQ